MMAILAVMVQAATGAAAAPQAATPPSATPTIVTPGSNARSRVALPGAERPRPVQQQTGVGKGAPVNGVLILYGNERCPTNSDGQEIVICERRSAQEQFRVPKELRDGEVTPQNQSWAARSQGVLETGVGVNGVGSCSTVGPGGATGCFGQAARTNRAINKARKAEEARVP